MAGRQDEVCLEDVCEVNRWCLQRRRTIVGPYRQVDLSAQLVSQVSKQEYSTAIVALVRTVAVYWDWR